MAGDFDPLTGPRAELAREIPRRPRVVWWMIGVFGIAFALVVMPTITAERWLGGGRVVAGQRAALTVRVPPFAGFMTSSGEVRGGVLIARNEVATADDEATAASIAETQPAGTSLYGAFLLLAAVLGGLFAHHTRRSNRGRLVRVQIVSLGLIALAAIAVKVLMLTTAISVLAVPVAVFAIVPTLVIDRVVGLAVGTLAALVVSLLVPFDVGVAILLLVQAGVAGLVVPEQPKTRWRAVLLGGGLATLLTGLTYPLLWYLTRGQLPLAELKDPLHSAWVAAVIGPALATAFAVPLTPLYQLMVGEITSGKLIQLADLSHPLLTQISERSPGTWQHSLTMANMAEIAANAIGANGRLVRVGAYFHDLGKSLAPKYFIENLEPGETSPHDQLPPETSCDAIFAHVTEGIVTARRAGLHERIIDFMHMHHGNGVLEYFWAKCKDQGNPNGLGVEHFRYPGVPPQSRETAILAICDAVEAASRTIKKADPAAIDNLVQRIVYGKLDLGQLDESGLSMADLRKMTDSLRETIRHANHGRIEYPWQKAQQDASASGLPIEAMTSTGPRLDSLDRPARPDSVRVRTPRDSDEAYAATGKSGETPNLRKPSIEDLAMQETAPAVRAGDRTGVRRLEPANDAAAREVSKARRDVQNEVARVLGSEPRGNKPTAPPVKEFVADASHAVDEASKERAAIPREPTDTSRKRAATIPPVTPLPRRSPTMPPLPGNRFPPTPPVTHAGHAPGPRPEKPPAHVVDESAHSRRVTVERVAVDAAITQPRMLVADDSSRTNPRMAPAPAGSDPDDTRPNIQLPLIAPPASDPAITLPSSAESSWARGLAARIDAAIDDDFGGETPVIAPTRAELQALLGVAPDPTRVQSAEEIDALHLAALEHSSEPDFELVKPRRAFPTAEVEESDIEAAIELAPPARKPSTAIGVAKKKPNE